MTLPTNEEMREAREAIDRDGPLAPFTAEICRLVLKSPELRSVVEKLATVEQPDGRALIIAAIATGLNYGLRIAAARQRCGTSATPASR
jgi:hypothetical protein